MKRSPRVALVVQTFPLDSPFILAKFEALVPRLDTWLVSLEPRKSGVLRAQNDALRARVRFAWPTRPRVVTALLLVPMLARCLVRNPGATFRYMFSRSGGAIGTAARLRRLYLDADRQ